MIAKEKIIKALHESAKVTMIENGVQVTNIYSEQADSILKLLENNFIELKDIRNKLTPIRNLIVLIENGLVKGEVDAHELVLKEIEQCKKSIEYLSKKPE